MTIDNRYLSIPEAAKLLGISRIAVYKKVKNGEMKALKFGNRYAIDNSYLSEVMGKKTGSTRQKIVESAIKRLVEEYHELIVKLGDE